MRTPRLALALIPAVTVALLTGLIAEPARALSAPAVTASTSAMIPPPISSAWLGVNTLGRSGSWAGAPLPDGTVLPAGTFGTVRWWDDSPLWGTRWCDLQPNPSADVDALMTAKLDPKLDAAAAHGVSRIIMVTGHAAPWVFDPYGSDPAAQAWQSDGSQTASNITGGGFHPWFCAGERSSVSMPSAYYIGPGTSPRAGATRWKAYTTRLLTHIQRWANRRANVTSGARLPFTIYFQTFNEPAWMARPDTGVPYSATTTWEIGSALVAYDRIFRQQMDTLAGLDRSRLRLLVSPATRPVFPYLVLADRAAAVARFSNYARLYDGMSFHTYSKQKAVQVPAADLVAEYDSNLAGYIAPLRDGRLPNLGTLPVFQTETNMGLAVNAEQQAVNAAATYSHGERSLLVSRMLLAAVRYGLAGNALYTLNGENSQYATQFYLWGGNLRADSSSQTLLRVRGWIVGWSPLGCLIKGSLVLCRLRKGTTTSVIAWSTGAPAPLALPYPTRVQRAEGVVINERRPAGNTMWIGLLPVRFTPVP